MTRHLVASALFAGLAAGLLAALLQLWLVVPLIVEAEAFEGAARVNADGTVEAHDPAPVGATAVRHLGTLGATLVTYTGFAFLLVAGFALAERAGRRIDTRRGLMWGLCGFLAVHLAPALGLPPELPGAVAADLAPRQAWWTLTVALSAAGIACLAFGRSILAVGAGLVLLVAPHLWGAPAAPVGHGAPPPELAAHYAATALAVAAAGWALLGAIAAAIWARGA